MSIDGQGVSTHAELVDMRSSGTIRVMIQAAGFQEKVIILKIAFQARRGDWKTKRSNLLLGRATLVLIPSDSKKIGI